MRRIGPGCLENEQDGSRIPGESTGWVQDAWGVRRMGLGCLRNAQDGSRMPEECAGWV